jgi:DNA/RNA endonuclease G (NUC1)
MNENVPLQELIRTMAAISLFTVFCLPSSRADDLDVPPPRVNSVVMTDTSTPSLPKHAPKDRKPAPEKAFTNGIGMELVWVSPTKCWVGKYDVTQREYEKLIGNNPSYFITPRRPVERVSWNDATAYAQKLTESERSTGNLPQGYEYRLPTDAEYDVYVGDATISDSVIGMPEGDTIDWSKVSQATAVVGSKAPNKYGLYDTRGNVEQWMQDWYTDAIKALDDQNNPGLSDAGDGHTYKFTRGGSWTSGNVPQVKWRFCLEPTVMRKDVGFRIVLALGDEFRSWNSTDNRKISVSRRRVALFCAFVILLFFIGVLWWLENSRIELRQGRNRTSQENFGKRETLVKYGEPIPHELVGPYLVLRNRGYVSGYDSGIQDPRWVETRFFSVSNPSSVARPKGFSPDPRVEASFQVNTHYWTDTGYDRGHMAPNWGVSICYGREAQVETFLLTNVVPQSPALNRGLWDTLEKIISNDYANRFGQVWVVCGPIFGTKPPTLKDGMVLVPDRCYKIVLRVDGDGHPHALAFVMPQDLPMGHEQRYLLQYLTNISTIEVQTGITFFPEAPASERQTLEDGTATRLW